MLATITYTLIAHLLGLLSAAQPQEATLVFAGDAMMHKSQLEAAHRAGSDYDFNGYFDYFHPYIKGADYAVVNLETPIGNRNFTGYPCFNAPLAYAQQLKKAGFDMMLTANNHCLDRGDQGLRYTIAMLDSLDLDHVGTYYNYAQRDSVLPIIQNVKGINIAFLNYTYGTNGIQVKGDVVVDYIDKTRIKRDISKARRSGAELVCVTIHWGDEYFLLPNKTQRALAQYLLDEDVDMVIGGHPHVIQPMEMRTDAQGRKKLLVYSLGNFISGMKTVDTRGGAMVRVHVSRDAEGTARVDSASYRLVFVEPPSVGLNYRLVDPDSCKSQWQQKAQAFSKSARAIFNKHNVDVPERK